MLPIMKGYASYKDVFVHKIYGIEDFDLFWQMINYQTLVDTWTVIEEESKR